MHSATDQAAMSPGEGAQAIAGLGDPSKPSAIADDGAALPARNLRERHHALTRELILRSVVDELEKGEPSELTVADVARAAGVSIRTLYRHFATREELLAAASEWIAENYFAVPGLPETLEGQIEALELQPISWDEHPKLVRSMALSRVGRAVRSQRRAGRLKLIHRALAQLTENLSEQEQRQAEAVFGYLNNMLAWITMRDENGLRGEEIGKALRWALETLSDDLRRRNAAVSKRNEAKV
jgi:AcrR family transcriptional regulator